MTLPGADAVDLLMREHRLVEQLFLQLDAAVEAGNEADQREVADRIVSELTAHAAIEEEVLYPAARKVAELAGLVDESEAEHAEVKALLAGLAGKDPGDTGFVEGFAKARELVSHHVDEEEAELFPKLREATAPYELEVLRSRLVEAREKAPTSPRSGNPVAAVADAAGSLIDRARGAFRHNK